MEDGGGLRREGVLLQEGQLGGRLVGQARRLLALGVHGEDAVGGLGGQRTLATATQAPDLLPGGVRGHRDGHKRDRGAAAIDHCGRRMLRRLAVGGLLVALLWFLIRRKCERLVGSVGLRGRMLLLLLWELGAVHVVHMVLQLVLPLEGGTAVGAVEGAGVRVDHHVLGQGLLDAEALVALGAPVRFLARVCPEVHFQTGLPFEFFLAHLTLVHRRFILLPHFLSQMHGSVVDREMVRPSEALATLLTLVGLFPRVCFLVFGQVVVAYECLPAFVTLVPLVVVVHSEVEPVGVSVTEALATDAAEVRSLPAVDPQVLLQRGPLPH